MSHFQAELQQRKNVTLRTHMGFGAICSEKNDCFVVRVPNRTEDTLVAAMLAMIDQDSFIVTDSFTSYHSLSKYGFASHEMINHRKCFVRSNDRSINTQKIKRQWRELRSSFSSVGRKDQTLERQNEFFDSYISFHVYKQR